MFVIRLRYNPPSGMPRGVFACDPPRVLHKYDGKTLPEQGSLARWEVEEEGEDEEERERGEVKRFWCR